MTTTTKFYYYTFALLGVTLMLFSSCEKDNKVVIYGDGVTDIDGNEYASVIIGDQEWMAENLKTTKYNNGTPIPNVTINFDWFNQTSDAYAWYDNNEASYKNAYGALYNWYAVNTGNLCPTGWHVSSYAEWTVLTDYVGGASIAGNKLKSTSGWSFGGNGTDDFGFSALPGGNRASDYGFFYGVGGFGGWWSSTESNASCAWYRSMSYGGEYVHCSNYYKKYGFSVRCVKDN
jgi:uncharacterized protein (TIGR02145 family)